MGIYEMLMKNSPYKSSMEKENQSQFEKLVDTNKELVDKIKELEHYIFLYSKYLNDIAELLDIEECSYERIIEKINIMKSQLIILTGSDKK